MKGTKLNRWGLNETKQRLHVKNIWHVDLALLFVTVDYKVHMLALGSARHWGRREVWGGTRTSCYVKTNLGRRKQRLRPPLMVLQVVRDSDIFRLRIMEAISLLSDVNRVRPSPPNAQRQMFTMSRVKKKKMTLMSKMNQKPPLSHLIHYFHAYNWCFVNLHLISSLQSSSKYRHL